MKKRYKIGETEFNQIISQLKSSLAANKNVVFALVYSTFLEKSDFGDIDIAVYADDRKEDYFDIEFSIEEEIKCGIPYPVDVKILNNAPLSFCYNVIKNGVVIVNKDDSLRDEFTRMVLRNYLDFLPFRQRYLEEVLMDEV